jgi:pimeloyl-ACP methyl ester carboxylesterase
MKRRVQVGSTSVAYLDDGQGPPLVLLHGCPFSSVIWTKVIARLRNRFRCIAPDLLGLGDTETVADADWSLPAQARMVVGLLDTIGLDQVDLVGHDHGAATAQILAAEHPQRIRRLVLTNAEAYDNWPSKAELPFVRLTQLPVLGRLVMWAWSRRRLYAYALLSGKAVYDPAALTPELLRGYIAANFATADRRAKTRRFLAGQLDRANQQATAVAAPGLRSFDRPTLIVWGENDPHFGPEWGERLQRDIPGAQPLILLPATGHLLMEERPELLAELIAGFLTSAPVASPST